ncbi:MAG: YybS family protein [Bdellovibrionaceae bacterium]|nr:YybS family protein [Pseudobdellovibrionaceae bacterium]NUM59585.1 DUF2232 domain-containing protein [Pseudobdellovibrionaceae bacterium]
MSSRKNKSPKKLSLLVIYSLITALVTVFFSGPFLRVLRRSYGPMVYWSLFIALVSASAITKTYLVLCFLGALWLTLGLSVEFEKARMSFSINLLISSIVGALFSMGGYVYVLAEEGINNFERFKVYFKEAVETFLKAKSEVEVDWEMLIYQIPSMVMLFFLVSIVVGYLFERRVYFWLKLPKQSTFYKINFLDYKVSELTVWVSLFALLIGVLDLKNLNLENLKIWQAVSSNLINILVIVFFFQGMAIMESFLRKIKAGIFFRAFTYFIFIGQLFLVLSLLGFIDFWIDFRTRIDKMGWLKNEI